MRANALAALTITLVSAFAFGFSETGHAAPQQPRVQNGRLTSQPAGASLDAAFRRLVAAQAEAAWIGYSVPVISRSEGRLCCSGDTWVSDGIVFTNGRIATCGLEPSTSTRRASDQPAQMQNPVRLEGPENVVVLYRIEEKAVQRIRIVSPDCELDAGGKAITWLDGVNAAESVKLLSTFVSRADVKSDRLSDSAISAIAMHRDDTADAELEVLGGSANPEFGRKNVTLWMGNARGRRGFEAVKKIAR